MAGAVLSEYTNEVFSPQQSWLLVCPPIRLVSDGVRKFEAHEVYG